MKHLRHLFTALAVLTTVSISTGYSQDNWPRTFFVGANHVRCDLTTGAVDIWPHYIQAVDSTTPNWMNWNFPPPPDPDLSLPFRILHDQRFIQLQDLGLNLAEFTIDPAHLSRSLIPPPPALRIMS